MDSSTLKESSESGKLLERHQNALILWCRWNDAHERLTKSMFEQQHDSRAVEDMLDQLDRLRLKALEASRELLDAPQVGSRNVDAGDDAS